MIDQPQLQEVLSLQFSQNVTLKKKRPDVLQVYAPFFHEDGDMLDIYVAPGPDGRVRVCDFGQTLMRLSYTFDLDTDNKQRIFKELLDENLVEFSESDGNIFVDTPEADLGAAVLHFSQVVAKVSRLDILRRAMTSGLFFELLKEFIDANLAEFRPAFGFLPIPERDDLDVTCAFAIEPDPVYLIAVRGSSTARLAALSFLEFQRAKLKFSGHVVHDDMGKLPQKDLRRITSAADKQYPSLSDFKEHAQSVLLRAAG